MANADSENQKCECLSPDGQSLREKQYDGPQKDKSRSPEVKGQLIACCEKNNQNGHSDHADDFEQDKQSA